MKWSRILCLLGQHDYTNLAKQGVAPDPVRQLANPVDYFFEYSRMFCARPGCKWSRRGA